MNEVKEDDQNVAEQVDYKEKFRNLKRKLTSLIYEQECFHEELQKIQKKCLQVNRDKSFLLDRLLQYEKPALFSSDEELTDSTDEEQGERETPVKIKPSTSKSFVKKSSPGASSPGEKCKKTVEKVLCNHVENGKQCTKLVSVKVKSGICYIHRLEVEKQASKPHSTPPKRVYPPTGGKDIGQIREAMQASSQISTSNEDNDDLVIDLPR